MKDKLAKNNQGPFRYTVKKFSRKFALCLIAIGVVAIPITIAAAVTVDDGVNEVNTSTNEAIDVQTEDSDLLTY